MSFLGLDRSVVVDCCLNVLKKGRSTAIGRPQVFKLWSGFLVPHLRLRNFCAWSKACLVELRERLVPIKVQNWLFNFESEDVPSFSIMVFG